MCYKISFTPIFIAVFLSALFNTSCTNNSQEVKIVVTLVQAGNKEKNEVTGAGWRYISGAKLALINPDNPSSLKILSGDFYSACSPDVSWDGRHMLFAAQKKKDDLWQIWEMDFKNYSVRQVVQCGESCTDPAYLPLDRVVFSKRSDDSLSGAEHYIYVCNTDGSDIRQISFHPQSNFATTVLKDGRLLSITSQLIPTVGDQMFMIMRPDGTKADLFYKGNKGSSLSGRGKETADGRIFFIETDTANTKRGDVVSITYNRPLHSRSIYTGEIAGNFGCVVPLPSGKLLVSYQKTENDPFALYEFDIVNKALGSMVYAPKNISIVDAAVVHEQARPKKLPSEVDMGVKTGQLLCQNIHFSDMGIAMDNATQIEVMGIDSSMGIVQVEKDGSFYLKIMADTPFKIKTLDSNNHVVNGPSGWIWLRPNERRGCIGCHEDPELAPENLVPLSVKKAPVNIPVQSAKIGEKAVELE